MVLANQGLLREECLTGLGHQPPVRDDELGLLLADEALECCAVRDDVTLVEVAVRADEVATRQLDRCFERVSQIKMLLALLTFFDVHSNMDRNE